jgi:hypothetical protein
MSGVMKSAKSQHSGVRLVAICLVVLLIALSGVVYLNKSYFSPRIKFLNNWAKGQFAGVHKVLDFTWPKVYDDSYHKVTSDSIQSITASENGDVFVIYPSVVHVVQQADITKVDDNSSQGVVQEYNPTSKQLVKECDNIPNGHASQSAYYEGSVYTIAWKPLTNMPELVKVDMSTCQVQKLTLKTSQELVWGAMDIFGGKIYLMGEDWGGYPVECKTCKADINVVNVFDVKTLELQRESTVLPFSENDNKYIADGFQVISQNQAVFKARDSGGVALLLLLNLKDGTSQRIDNSQMTALTWSEGFVVIGDKIYLSSDYFPGVDTIALYEYQWRH